MATVVWLPGAYADFEDIRRYIARDRPGAALDVIQSIVRATRQLSAFPRQGRVVPEFERSDLRELIVRSHRLIYRLDRDRVLILAVRHGARRLDDLPDR